MDAKTLILGCTLDARKIAEELLEKNGHVIVAIPDTARVAGLFDDLNSGKKANRLEILTVTDSFSIGGFVGHFNLVFNKNSNPLLRTVSSIIIVDAVERKTNFGLYGVAASDAVVSLSQIYEYIQPESDHKKRKILGKRVAFLTGLATESSPVITEEIMHCALRLQQEFNRQTYIFTGNLKVSPNESEALYRQTKKAGTIYIKFTETTPEIQTDKSGNTIITYIDEIIHKTFILNPDITVIDETLHPSPFSQKIADKLNIETGPDGFIQSANVHRATVLTNRKGIFVAGFSRNAQPKDDRQLDIENAALCVLNLYKKSPPEKLLGKAEINFNGHCIHCLTCLRVCPHGAISLIPKIEVNPHSCEGCGVCAAECPQLAIKINDPVGETIPDKNMDSQKAAGSMHFSPSIMAFCCSRSAREAGELASHMGYSLPPGLQIVEVPCAGSISLKHLFSALEKGYDGVLVMTCHKGNCRSECGNIYANNRVAQVSSLLPELGVDPNRLACKSLASNMGTEFAETINAFNNTLLELGPSQLKGM